MIIYVQEHVAKTKSRHALLETVDTAHDVHVHVVLAYLENQHYYIIANVSLPLHLWRKTWFSYKHITCNVYSHVNAQ